MGRYPTAEEGLELLVSPPVDVSLAANWFGPYVDGDSLPTDPWGRGYVYTPPVTDDRGVATTPKILSYGADGQPGGEGLNADVGA